MIDFYITRNGLLRNKHGKRCPINSTTPDKCTSCPNCISKATFYGRVDRILCKGEKLS